jgi:hypothetical protein
MPRCLYLGLHAQGYCPERLSQFVLAFPFLIVWLQQEGDRMILNQESAQQLTRRENVARYRKILGTYLTAEERHFVERRLAEEQDALQQFAECLAPIGTSNYAA